MRRQSTVTKHNIVVLDDCFAPCAQFDFDYVITYYSSTEPHQLPARIEDATIVIVTDTRVTREGILGAQRLQLVAANGTGTDRIDKTALRELGIGLCNLPAQTTESVAEHALALYYGLRRNLLEMHAITMAGKAWATCGNTQIRFQRSTPPPRTNAEETMVVLGYGTLGKKIESLGKALGMNVVIAERKGAQETRPGRLPFPQCLKLGTIFVIAAPLNETTQGMIGTSELAAMDPTSLVINIGRGGIIDELALAHSLRKGQIGGAATDVYEIEPATTANSPLLDPTIPNLLLSPHTAWYSKRSIDNVLLAQKLNLEAFVAGNMTNVVIAPR
ncbi:uncharacterized protein G6M90_00g106190 [Metarhizium brunneum]|uniref:Glycerate dehydrogenase n=1 Tax=Metarhizium brunneum TaxID=500148 RepID=A0A7D5ZBQ6_9HYPO